MEMRDRLIDILTKHWFDGMTMGECADMLIANGVTVQEWISVKDRMPEEDNRVLVWLGVKLYDYTRIDTDRLHNGRWVRWGKDVTHWMPLPNPPKEQAENALKERVDNG